MIGVSFRDEQRAAVEEFFELFKTPWEPWRSGESYHTVLVGEGASVPGGGARLTVVFGAAPRDGDTPADRAGELRAIDLDAGRIPLQGRALRLESAGGASCCAAGEGGTAAVRSEGSGQVIVRAGYDLFDEVRRLLGPGQPPAEAGSPALDLHIELLRRWMIEAGVGFVEIPPVPAGYRFAVCLTHDIDFVGIRRHKFDHTMFGFLYRATVGSLIEFLKGARSFGQLCRNVFAAIKLPFVWLGLAKDFWMQFDAYRAIERGLAPTYFFIPFRGRAGEKVNAAHAGRRACAYDLEEVAALARELAAEGCEVGVHGIDSWHDAGRGREELARVAALKGDGAIGIRMHWLLQDEHTPHVLERAGYLYDSTSGYNDAVGYRAGTHQVFRPLGCERLMELPMHIQDGALFYGSKLALRDAQAWKVCGAVLAHVERSGGVLTVLWHDRSLGPERYWGDFYVRLVAHLRGLGAWFANARSVVDWFRARRAVAFCRGAAGIELTGAAKCSPSLVIREHRPGGAPLDRAWDGSASIQIQAANPT